MENHMISPSSLPLPGFPAGASMNASTTDNASDQTWSPALVPSAITRQENGPCQAAGLQRRR